MATFEALDLRERVAPICRRWNIEELSVFGSVARGTDSEGSDVDLLVRFHPSSRLGLWDLVRLTHELEEALGRSVDLVELGAIENPYLRASIERDARVVYVG
jgi:predicted nucleotidyltransferase